MLKEEEKKEILSLLLKIKKININFYDRMLANCKIDNANKKQLVDTFSPIIQENDDPEIDRILRNIIGIIVSNNIKINKGIKR